MNPKDAICIKLIDATHIFWNSAEVSFSSQSHSEENLLFADFADQKKICYSGDGRSQFIQQLFLHTKNYMQTANAGKL